MRILALSGSLRAESYNTALARAAAELAPAGRRGRALRRPRRRCRSTTRTSTRARMPTPDAVARPARAHRGRRRAPRRDARVQRLDPRRAQERDRLGLGPPPRELAPGQDGRRRRRHDRPVRRDLGAAGPPQRARDRRRARGRRRAARLAGRARPSTRPARSATRSSPSACATHLATLVAEARARARGADVTRTTKGRASGPLVSYGDQR